MNAMIAHYREAKARHPGMLLLFRVGGEYLAFDEDAATCAHLMRLPCDSRDGSQVATIQEESLQSALRVLLQAGRRVAVCEQVDEAPRGKKVERVVTSDRSGLDKRA